MLGAAKSRQVTEQVTKAVRSAGGLVVAALAVACSALLIAGVALVLVLKARPA